MSKNTPAQAQLIEVLEGSNGVVFRVILFDDVIKYERDYVWDGATDPDQFLSRQVTVELDRMDSTEKDAAKKLAPGPIARFVPPIPTQEELNRQQFLSDYSRLRKLKELQDLGVTAVVADATALATAMNLAYKSGMV